MGPATLADFERLGVRDLEGLARSDPQELYDELSAAAGRQDPCVLDVFACAVAQARDPQLPAAQRNWWWWSRQRLARSGGSPERSR